MHQEIKCLFRDRQFPLGLREPLPGWLAPDAVEKVAAYHKKIPGYSSTPLVALKTTAAYFRLKDIWVKDESFRMGLNAFKVLGASWAIARYLAQRSGQAVETVTWEDMKTFVETQPEAITFVTATDGNHGRAVAWVAQQLGCKAVVYMPKGSASHRLEAIRATGASAEITDMNYDDAVRLASRMADEKGWVLVQDTAWDGYEEIPQWIMEGYATITHEIEAQLKAMDEGFPTHIILQAGVGSFAGGVLGALASLWKDALPMVIIAEPEAAACIYESAKAGDGARRIVGGDLTTIMAGLACGEPNLDAWPILRDYAFAWMACSDGIAAEGMRLLARPFGADHPIVSGESGAVGMGILAYLSDPARDGLRDALKLGADSKVLIISTEGDTDPDNYRKIVSV